MKCPKVSELPAAGSARAPDIQPLDAFLELAMAKFDGKTDNLLLNVTAAADAMALPSTRELKFNKLIKN